MSIMEAKWHLSGKNIKFRTCEANATIVVTAVKDVFVFENGVLAFASRNGFTCSGEFAVDAFMTAVYLGK
jgi:hypothetical protein